MEPVTYIVGILAVLGGYGYFLSNRREASYSNALHLTVSRRQQVLYESKGFDLSRWQTVIDEANHLRKEIRVIASEYDVEWSEKSDAKNEDVVKALRSSRRKARKREQEEEDDDDDVEEEEEVEEKKESQSKDGTDKNQQRK